MIVARLTSEGLEFVEAIQIDVSNMKSIEAARNILGKKINSLNVLVNNAGVSGGFAQLTPTFDIHSIRKVFDTNLSNNCGNPGFSRFVKKN